MFLFISSSSAFCWRKFSRWFFASSWILYNLLAWRRFVITTFMELLLIIDYDLSFLNTLWIWNFVDNSFLFSDMMIFHRLTSMISVSSVVVHMYYFCLFFIARSDISMPVVMSSSSSLLPFVSTCVSVLFESFSFSLLVLSKILCCLVNVIKVCL